MPRAAFSRAPWVAAGFGAALFGAFLEVLSPAAAPSSSGGVGGVRRSTGLLGSFLAPVQLEQSEAIFDGKLDDEMEQFLDYARNCSSYAQESVDFDGKKWQSICEALKPEKLPPYYLMPVVFFLKLLVTVLFFGYELKFKKPAEQAEPEGSSSGVLVTAAYLVATAGSLASIAAAANGYVRDYKDWVAVVPQGASPFVSVEGLVLVAVVWVTSPNYIAAVAVWNSFTFQSPPRALRLKQPKYRTIPCTSSFPLIPGEASWLKPLKHIYLLVLLPYFIPRILLWPVLFMAQTAWHGCFLW